MYAVVVECQQESKPHWDENCCFVSQRVRFQGIGYFEMKMNEIIGIGLTLTRHNMTTLVTHLTYPFDNRVLRIN